MEQFRSFAVGGSTYLLRTNTAFSYTTGKAWKGEGGRKYIVSTVWSFFKRNRFFRVEKCEIKYLCEQSSMLRSHNK